MKKNGLHGLLKAVYEIVKEAFILNEIDVYFEGENNPNPLQEEYAIDVIRIGEEEKIIACIVTVNKDIKQFYLLKENEELFRVIQNVIEDALDKVGWDNVKWLIIDMSRKIIEPY